MLRTRDIVAIILAVILARIAWTSGPADDASLSAGMRLAFYAPAKLAAPFDVDGDGIYEAMVVLVDGELQILDLKGMDKAAMPIEPPVLFKTKVEPSNGEPLKLTTGQIIWNHHYHHHRHHSFHHNSKKDTPQVEDRTRHYFCGADWHDAAENCRQHCPTGSSADCPEGETCYADTPCDALRSKSSEEEAPQDYTLTPAGGLPAIMTYWSSGKLTVHTLSSTSKDEPLELQLLWEHNVGVHLEEVHIDLLASEDVRTDSHLGQHGMVLIGGTYEEEHHEDEFVSMMQAYDAMTGLHMWSTPKPHDTNEPLFLNVRGAKSAARRRSRIVSVQAHTESTELPNCMASFKQLVKQGLPHSYWTPSDARVTPLHFHRHKHQRHHPRNHAVHGRPNVLLSHYHDGIHVRSLLNGHALCHLSLLDEVVYADLNQDGVLDHVHVATNHHDDFDETVDDDFDTHENKWIAKLSQEMKKEQDKPKKNRNVPHSNRLCHVLVLSGLPTREQIFSANLCGNRMAQERGDHESIELEAAPPLVVDDTHVIVALNNGMISRYHVPTSKRLFQTTLSARVSNVPTWSDDYDAVSLSVLQSRKGRALLLTGDNSMVLMSLRSGNVLAEASFPQTSLDRPIVADVSGDGTPDIIIRSADAIWGYHVVLQSGASTLFRIIVGLLLMGIALALLRNKFGQKGDKRSTDV
jgi:hypothetical protein